MIGVLVILALALTGCAINTGFGLKADELVALSKIKDANASCLAIHATLYGDAIMVFASVDKGITAEIGVGKDCALTIRTEPILTIKKAEEPK